MNSLEFAQIAKNNMNKTFLLIITAIIIAIGGFFLFNQTKSQTDKPEVIASFYPLYFFASEIAGDKLTVTNLTPSGVEPHDYEPTPQNIAKIYESKLLLINGAGFEPWIEKLEQELTDKGVTIVNASESIALTEGAHEDEHEEEAGHAEEEELHEKEIFDPHVWLSPVLAKSQVAKITEGLTKIDPANKTYYEANAKTLTERLDALDQKYQSGLSSCQQKDFVTSHAAFAYLASEYHLTMTPIAGLSPEKEPSAQELAEVAAFAKDNNIKYIFFETLVSPKLSETIANEIDAKTLVLDPLEGLSEDNSKQGKNYFTVMETNLGALQEALKCSK